METRYQLEVPTETGGSIIVGVVHDQALDTFEVKFAGTLLDQAPEGVTAAIQMAMLQVQGLQPWRRKESR